LRIRGCVDALRKFYCGIGVQQFVYEPRNVFQQSTPVQVGQGVVGWKCRKKRALKVRTDTGIQRRTETMQIVFWWIAPGQPGAVRLQGNTVRTGHICNTRSAYSTSDVQTMRVWTIFVYSRRN
tara:strand:+ start:157 stop:525 length:369 start_codon:yes stop_codon:yes gene_type:complete